MSDFLRTPETSVKYKEHRASRLFKESCVICAAPVVEQFTHFRVIANKFPYDRIAAKHLMLVPTRHVTESELSAVEREELAVIKATYAMQFDYIMEGTARTKSIPQHFHLHLIVGKPVV